MISQQRGSALFYILIAVALLGMLSFTLTRQANQEGGVVGQMSEEKAQLLANDLMNHVSVMRSSIQQMVDIGTSDLTDISFVQPGDAAFATNPPADTDKVFHPVGGGVPAFDSSNAALFDGVGTTGWVFQTATNVEWSESTRTDLIATFINVHPAICASINKRINGSDAIPVEGSMNYTNFFEEGAGTDATLNAAGCAVCEGKISLCINNGTTNAFFNVVAQR